MRRKYSMMFIIIAVPLTALLTFVKPSGDRFAIAGSLSNIANHVTEQASISPSDLACPPHMDITDCDAELLAMEISGALLPPPSLYDQIHSDLTAIRQAYPYMNSISHRPRWAPGELIVGLTPEAWDRFQNGVYHGLDDLNAQYGPVTVTPLIPPPLPCLFLQFEERYNPGYLAPLYANADGVRYAEPNWFVGDGSDIQVSIPEYTFILAWGDCYSGCMYHHYWVFTVIEDTVTLVDEYGDPVEQDHKVYLPMLLHQNHSSGE